ncbi:unnamed protein product, partial [Gongylonema pulchrum]|uniref:ZP domain-containing protein n=1 Tax=Gongylonema pulchrum TaxID=637853 RepID=A0A183E2F7_9BILA
MRSAVQLFWMVLGCGLHLCMLIPIDNGVEGDPEVECGANVIVINFNTQNPFEGHVYVKGSFSDKTCRSTDSGHRVAGITVPFDRCNVMRSRSLNPRGIFVITTVVITFHVTKFPFISRIHKTVYGDKAVNSGSLL